MYTEIDGVIYQIDEDGNILDADTAVFPVDIGDVPEATESSEDLIEPLDPTEASEVSTEAPDPPIVVYEIPDDMIDALVSISTPSIYPSTSAVQIFQYVLQSYKDYKYYVIVPGSSSSDVYMYVADDATVSGSTISLSGDVWQCRYYTYRPSTSSSTQYLYSLTSYGDVSFTPSGSLIYTNALEGYPDIYPELQYSNQQYPLFFLVIGIIIMFIILFKRRSN